jgi:hypothetical protein
LLVTEPDSGDFLISLALLRLVGNEIDDYSDGIDQPRQHKAKLSATAVGGCYLQVAVNDLPKDDLIAFVSASSFFAGCWHLLQD